MVISSNLRRQFKENPQDKSFNIAAVSTIAAASTFYARSQIEQMIQDLVEKRAFLSNQSSCRKIYEKLTYLDKEIKLLTKNSSEYLYFSLFLTALSLFSIKKFSQLN